MTTFAAFDQAVGSVLLLRGVKGCLVISRDEEKLQSPHEIGRTVFVAAREAARQLLDSRTDRRVDQILDHVVISRSFEGVAIAIVGDATLDESEVHRKLNVVAIRAQATAAREAPSELAVALREVYVTHAGSLSGLVFDRAIEELRNGRQVLDMATLQPIVRALAETLTPPTNHRLLRAVEEFVAKWEAKPTGLGALGSRSPVRPIVSGAARAGDSASFRAAAPHALRRPTTVPQMAAVQLVVRELVGPLGDLLVQRALENATQAAGSSDIEPEKLISTIAAQLPAQHRDRFMAAGRAAVDSANDPIATTPRR